jgi:hypothetical protein
MLGRVSLLALFILASGCGRQPTFPASGTLRSLPTDMPELGGKGVWIQHEGLTYESEGRSVQLDGMRAPFKVGMTFRLDGIGVNERVSFRFRPRGDVRGFPFEVTELKRIHP